MKKNYSILDRDAWPLGVAFGVENEEEFFKTDWIELALITVAFLATFAALWYIDHAVNAYLDYLMAAPYETTLSK